MSLPTAERRTRCCTQQTINDQRSTISACCLLCYLPFSFLHYRRAGRQSYCPTSQFIHCLPACSPTAARIRFHPITAHGKLNYFDCFRSIIHTILQCFSRDLKPQSASRMRFSIKLRTSRSALAQPVGGSLPGTCVMIHQTLAFVLLPL